MYHRILIALQGKETDQAVVNHVKDLAAHTGAELVLLRVIGVADDGGGGLGKQFQLETELIPGKHRFSEPCLVDAGKIYKVMP